jgi:hypothetical protein
VASHPGIAENRQHEKGNIMIQAPPLQNQIARDAHSIQSAWEMEVGSSPGHGVLNGRKRNRIRNRDRCFDWQSVISGSPPRPLQLLILGASGQVAQAFLQRLANRRQDFGRVVLVDPDDEVLRNRYLDHDYLDYEFLRREIRFPHDTADYHRLLRQKQIHVVLDLTDLDTLPVLAATDAVGVSYINTALNESKRNVAEVVADVHPTRARPRNAPHILGSGMNPGVVNLWVWHGFQRYGAPAEIVHFEYDTSVPAQGWQPMITWSRQEFLAETVWEATGHVVRGELQMCAGNSLQHREDLRPIMQPVISLPEYPRGLLVLHEENVKLGAKLGASSKYVYAIHPRTMSFMEQQWRRQGRVEVGDLLLGDNTSIALEGEDIIGVSLEYPDRRVYYVHRLGNHEVTGTNATCAQVAVGADAALQALISERLSPRIYFASDLYASAYSEVAFDALAVEHFVFQKQNGSLIPRDHVPRLRPRRTRTNVTATA